MRNEYSKALGQNMSWSEWVGDARRMTWDVRMFHTEDEIREILDSAGLTYKKVKTSQVIRDDLDWRRTRHYIRIYI